MNIRQISIVLVSNNPQRLQTINALLSPDSGNKVQTTNFELAFQQVFIEETPDILILDTTSYANFDYRIVEPLRSQIKYKNLPFIFIIASTKNTLIQQLYKNPHNRVLLDPVNKYMIISEINNSIHLNELEHKVGLYKDIIDGEKQLISYMDELLELNRMADFKSKKSLMDYVQSRFVKRLELALAVEMCFIAVFNEEEQSLEIKLYSEDAKNVIRDIKISVKQSKIADLLQNNYPHIFENDLLLDTFIQELEELLGIKITGLLFAPMVLLHKPLAAIILVNKLYRTEFSENDLAFATIAAQKVVYRFEKLEMFASDGTPFPLKRSSVKTEYSGDLLLNKVLSTVDFGLVIFDEDMNIHYNNAACQAILRIARPVEHLTELFDKSVFDDINKNFTYGDFPVNRMETRLTLENESEFYIVYSIYALSGQDNTPYFALVFNEVSQTKRIQAEVIRMDRMVSLGILSSGIAHEIRNPLAGIKAMVQNMEEELPPGSNTLEYTVRILRQVDRLDNLLKSFFSYAKPTRPDPKKCQFKIILDECLALFVTSLKEKNIKVQIDFADDLSWVFVDPNQIQQVLINIILNAIQAMDSKGTIKISAVNAQRKTPTIDRRKRIPGLLSDQFIEILISDTGSGFDDNLKDKIFNPFFTTKGSGTGLGLAIVYQIIREHGGHIDVESKKDAGTTFKILLPAAADKE